MILIIGTNSCNKLIGISNEVGYVSSHYEIKNKSEKDMKTPLIEKINMQQKLRMQKIIFLSLHAILEKRELEIQIVVEALRKMIAPRIDYGLC